jgi:hypothetical protein
MAIRVYPNPVGLNQEFTVEIPDQMSENRIVIHIIDLTGKVIEKRESQGKNKIEFPADLLSKGSYIVKISSDKVSTFKKIISF